MIALEARKLVKQYPGVLAVNEVSFEVRAGICFGLLGPNGAGKTTTVEIMEGVTPATSGEVYYFGKPAGIKFREEAGIQFQNTALQDYLTVRESLEMFHSLYDRQADLEHIIRECSLEELVDRDNRKLSGGQRQRLFLAIALVNRPRLVFLDEPTTGLDPQARRNFWDLLNRIRSDGTTVILTTHYMDEAEILCDEIAIMDVGQIITQGSPADLLRERYQNVINGKIVATWCTQASASSSENQTPDRSIIGHVNRFNKPPASSSLVTLAATRSPIESRAMAPTNATRKSAR